MKATITLEDNADGSLNVAADFGDVVNQDSQAHSMAMVLIESVLKNAKSYQTLEDTAPEHNVEPSVIITPENPHGL